MHTFPRRAALSLLAGLATGLTGCAGRLDATGGQRLSVEPSTPPPPEPQPQVRETAAAEPGFDPAAVITAVRSVEPRATVAALVVDRANDAELLAIEPDRRFRSASLVKLLIAIDAMRAKGDNLMRKRLATMLSRSDDNIASSLWVEGGGSDIVARSAKRLGLVGTTPPRTAGRWGDVMITAHDLARVYQYVLTELPKQDSTLIVDALANAPRVAGDGFDQYFGIPDGLGGTWAIKQGWSSSATDLVFHSTGLIGDGWPYIVVLLTEHPLRIPGGVGPRSVTAGAKALSDLF